MANIRLSEISLTRGQPAGRWAWLRGGSLPRQVGRPFALHRFTLTVPHGRTLVILGPSGCGKSTLLRVIAGLDGTDSGRVLYNGKDVAGIRPGLRRIGYLFQSYALYPHFTSRENITAYFLFRRKTPEMNALRKHLFHRTSELLDVDISYLLDRKPSRLSGGEKQRVAMGRCITREPELFLLDEPFSNLDAKLRSHYRMHLKTLLREFGITTVYVTHDQQEAVLLGDLIAVMRSHSREDCNEGTLEQVGTVDELYQHPSNMFVADFLNLQGDVPAISFVAGAALAPALAGYTVGVRPEHVQVAALGEAGEAGEAGSAPSFRAQVTEVTEHPLHQHRVLNLRIGAEALVAKLPPNAPGLPGETVVLRFSHYHLFDPASGEAVHAEAARDVLG
jgi:multiple sugar transport system ATP-binding protein